MNIKRILCPIDFSQPAHAGLDVAVYVAKHFDAELLVVHVVAPLPIIPMPQASPAFDLSSYRNELIRSAEDGLDSLVSEKIPEAVTHRTVVVGGEPAYEIARIADDEDVDLIVTATHGESGWRKFIFGSVADRIVRTAPCAVLTVPQPRDNQEE